ncbi:unnamed protein product, partial [Effrenium voratum]
ARGAPGPGVRLVPRLRGHSLGSLRAGPAAAETVGLRAVAAEGLQVPPRRAPGRAPGPPWGPLAATADAAPAGAGGAQLGLEPPQAPEPGELHREGCASALAALGVKAAAAAELRPRSAARR